MNIFVLPIVYLTIIYTRLLYFIHYQTPQLSQTQQGRRAHRDLAITRRILFTVIALTLPGLPNIGFVFMTNINHQYSGAYFMYRIQWMGPSITVFILSISLIFMTPQIKKLLIKYLFRKNHVAPTVITMKNLQPSVFSLIRNQV